MKCTEVQDLLHMEPEGEFPAPVQNHLGRCHPCQQVQRDLLAMKRALRDIAPPSLPMGFELDLHRRLSEAARPTTRRSKETKPQRRGRQAVFAMAATVLLVLSGLMLWRSHSEPTPALQPGPETVAMQTVSYHRVHLAIHAEQAHPEALFDVELPRTAALAGGLESELGDGQVVRWRSDILPGVNEIDLPIVLRQDDPTPVQVRARLIASGKVFTTNIRITPIASGLREVEQTVKLAWVLESLSPATGRVQ